MAGLKGAETAQGGFQLVDNKLLYKGRYVLPQKSIFIPVLLKEYHDSVIGGHSGELKTYLRMARD